MKTLLRRIRRLLASREVAGVPTWLLWYASTVAGLAVGSGLGVILVWGQR